MTYHIYYFYHFVCTWQLAIALNLLLQKNEHLLLLKNNNDLEENDSYHVFFFFFFNSCGKTTRNLDKHNISYNNDLISFINISHFSDRFPKNSLFSSISSDVDSTIILIIRHPCLFHLTYVMYVSRYIITNRIINKITRVKAKEFSKTIFR